VTVNSEGIQVSKLLSKNTSYRGRFIVGKIRDDDELARLRGEVERSLDDNEALSSKLNYATIRAETAEARVRELEAIRKEQANGTPDHTELVTIMYATIFGDGKSMGLIDCIAGYYGACFESKLAEIEAKAKASGF
jgi:hypothetical protein